MVCLDNGLKVKFEWKGVCATLKSLVGGGNVTIPCRELHLLKAFVQGSLYPPATAETAGDNFELLQTALPRDRISVVGSAQWVEPSQARAHKNIVHMSNLFLDCNLRAEFHFDYHLDVNAEPMVWEALRQMRRGM